MGILSTIQWCMHTINFWMGCIKVSPGCKFCYMYRDKERYGQNPKTVTKVKDTTINKVLKAVEPNDRIFTCSWSDFFISQADEWRPEAWAIIKAYSYAYWLILTKRIEDVKERFPKGWNEGDYYTNVWLGVSVESQKELYRAGLLCTTMAETRFLSIEPMLGCVDLKLTPDPLWPGSYFNCLTGVCHNSHEIGGGELANDIDGALYGTIDWVIIGGESGNETGNYLYRPCSLEWFKEIIDDCKAAGVPVFVKQLGTYLAKEMGLKDRHGGDPDEWPEWLRIREFPNVPVLTKYK